MLIGRMNKSGGGKKVVATVFNFFLNTHSLKRNLYKHLLPISFIDSCVFTSVLYWCYI